MSEPPRAVRLLLFLFPARHRRAYGAEMWEVIRHRYATARGGSMRRMRLHLEVALDLVGSALGMWTKTTRRVVTMGPSRGWGIDVRFVLRSLRRSPGYVLTAVVVLAGAVAVNASVFGYVRGTLLAKPTYPDADRVVVIWGSNTVDGQRRDVISGPNYLDMARETTSLEAMAALHADDAMLTGDGSRPDVRDAFTVSVDFFRVVPVKPVFGRVFDERERNSGGQAAVIVSYAFWRDELGADPSWIGRSLSIGYAPHTVVGVLPEGFEFVVDVPLWLPAYDDVLAADDRSRIHYNVMGRLRPGATPADATGDLTGALRRITERTGMYRDWTILVEPLHEASVLAVRPILWTVTAAVAIVLLIALVNLATLFRIRALGRTDELGVRLALGGGIARVARVLVLEAAVLAGAGVLLGIALAEPLLARIRDLVPLWIPIPDSAARVPVLRAVLDPQVAVVTAALTVLGALALTVPALAGILRSGGAAWGGRRGGSARGTRWLVAAELALATVLCLGAGLTTRSAAKLLGTEVGLRDQGLLTLYLGDVWSTPIDEQVSYYRQAVEAVQALPGVTSAALIDYVPFQGEDDYARVYFLDRAFQPVEDQREEWRRVSLGLFEVAGMRMVAGRSFTSEDFEGTPRTAIVNESFARKHYRDRDAVGQLLSTHDEHYRDMTIVGVVADVRSKGPANPAPPMLYVPDQGDPRGTMGMYVRVAAGAPMAAADAVREAIWSVDPLQPVASFFPMSELVAQWVAIPRAVRALVSGLATLALLLAGVGVFGVVAYAVRRRSAELGVRLALGASPDRLTRETLAHAVPMVVGGVGGGLAAGWLAARAARAVLYGVQPLDPLSLGVAVLAMAAAALLATYLPARRIARIDPTMAMRSE